MLAGALAVGVAAALVGCGSGPGSAVAATGRGSVVSVRVLGRGANVDVEPSPRGTIVIDGPSRRHVWVQAIAAEDHERIVREGVSDGEGVTEDLGSGVTRSAYALDGAFRLVASDGSVAPSEVAPFVFDLASLPDGMRFVPASVAASMALDVDPMAESLEVLPAGVTALEISIAGEALGATTAAAEPGALVGSLLIERQEVAPGAWSGQIAPGHGVVLLEDDARDVVVVVHQPSAPDAVVAARSEIVEAVAAA